MRRTTKSEWLASRASNPLRAADELPEQFNAAEWFVGRHVAEGRSTREAIVCDDGSTSYGELDSLVRGFAALLRAHDVHRGERVGLILPDGLSFAVGFWGAIAAGAVAVPLNPLLGAADHRTILTDCDARLLVYDPAVADGQAAPADCAVLTADDALLRARVTMPQMGYARTHRDAFAFFLYSSGTTGEPKGVVHLQHDMWVCARTYAAQVLDLRPDDRAFSIAKLFFAYGLGNALYFPMDVGATCILYAGRPLPEAILAQVAAHKPTLFFGVPTAYAQLLGAIEAGARFDFSSVRACVSAGEALPPGVFERWKTTTGLEILDGIGSTEILHICISNRLGDCRPGASGRPVPGYDVRIVDETGRDVASGEIGDLIVRGDSTMALYWNKHERTKATLTGDWIRTGDKYRCDEHEFYYHAGRSDDMLKVGGIWVSPVEVEGALSAHDAVLECAVIGRADADDLVKPHAYVIVRDGRTTEGLDAELRAFVKERLAPHKAPRWITFVDALPKTPTGKTRRFVLRDQSIE